MRVRVLPPLICFGVAVRLCWYTFNWLALHFIWLLFFRLYCNLAFLRLTRAWTRRERLGAYVWRGVVIVQQNNKRFFLVYTTFFF